MDITFEILNQTEGKNREVLIAFSKQLRVANGDQGWGVTDRIRAGFTGDADLQYLEDKQSLRWSNDSSKIFVSVGEVSDFIMKSDNQYLKKYNTNNFINTIVDDVHASFAALAAAEGHGDGAGVRGGDGRAADTKAQADAAAQAAAAAAAAAAAQAAAATLRPAAEDEGGGNQGAVAWHAPITTATNQGVNFFLDAAAHSLQGVANLLRPEPADTKAQADADAKAKADAAAQAAAAPAQTSAGRGPAAAAAQPNPVADDEEKRKLIQLQTANPEARLEVFCDDDEIKKRQYDEKLARLLRDDPIYKKNKDSMFTYFVSPSEETSANNAFLPYVTKTDFHKILHKDSFANTASQYAVACKVELGNGEQIEMGDAKLSDQCFIDVQDSLNHTRIFLSKQNFKKLEEYKKNLVKEFKELLQKNNANFKNPSADFTKKEIEDEIFKFGSIKDVKRAIGGVPVSPVSPAPPAPPAPPNALSTESLASKVDLTSADDIDKYARILADQFWQRKLVKGDLSVEVEKTGSLGEYEDKERLGHVKIVRPKTKTNEDRIKVYKVGSDNEIGLDHVNLGMGNQIMQIEVKKITEGGVKGVQYFKENPQQKNNFNVRVDNKNELNDKVKKAKVDVFVEDLANKKMSRLKIRGGADNSKPITTKANKIVTPYDQVCPSARAPKIFTLRDDRRIKIGEGTISFPCTEGILKTNINIKKNKNGKFKIEYGNNKIKCCSCLSSSKGGWLFNQNLTSLNGVDKPFILQKEKKWNKFNPHLSCVRTERHLAVQVQVLDKGKEEIVTLEIRKKGSRVGDWTAFKVWRARNELEVTEVSKVKEVPTTIFEPQNAISVVPAQAAGRATVRR